jgi:hypothetical protein
MRTDGATHLTGTIIVLTLSLALAATASAGSLLSGYGGPGQGNQAILGSALVNGPSGGSGGGGAAASVSGEGSGAPSAAGSGATGHGGSSHAKGAGGGRSGERSSGSARGANTDTGTKVSVTPQAAVGGSSVLGLSGVDVLYILLALAVLVATGLLTRQMTRRPG